MLKAIARFQLRGLCRFARGASGPSPANDNFPIHRASRSAGLDRTTRPRLLCRWSTDSDGLVCRWSTEIVNDVGLFARASWNDGRNQILSFTDIDRSLSGGLSIKGSRWGRPDDTIGIGGAINGLSGDHRDFIAAGGLGPLIGDGQLNYRKERILETYYAYALNKQITLTADYQFVTNPAYNADRGPVHVFSGRLHGEF